LQNKENRKRKVQVKVPNKGEMHDLKGILQGKLFNFKCIDGHSYI